MPEPERTECHRGIFTVGGALPWQSAQPTMTYEPLRGPIWTISDGIYRTIFLEGARGVVAFDTFGTPGGAVAYRKALNRVLPGRDVHTVVYSHDHLDHTGYALDLAPGAEVIAHEECAQVVAARGSDGQAPATHSWTGARTRFELDGVDFELINPGATHGNGNVAALFERERVLFMVDTVAPGVGYTFMPDWHVGGYIATMRTLLEEDWDLFVPGHFWALGRAEFEANLDFQEALAAVAQDALAVGVDPDDLAEVEAVARRQLGPQFGHLFRFEEYAGQNLMRWMLHFRTGGWGFEDNGPERWRTPRARGSIRRAPVEVERVGENLWTASSGDHRTVFAGRAGEDGGVLAVNTFGSPVAARGYRAAIEGALPGAEVQTVLCSIDHLDHAGHAAQLAPDAEIVAHERAAAVIAARGAVDQRPVDRAVGDDTRLRVGGVEARLVYPGPTVGTGNLAVHFPAERALFVVGPRADARYGLFPDFHLARAADGFAALLELDWDVLIPGRGPMTDRAGLERAVAYMRALDYAAQKSFAFGVAVWDINAVREFVDELVAGEFGGLAGYRDHVGIGALRFAHHYLMGGWGLEDTPHG